MPYTPEPGSLASLTHKYQQHIGQHPLRDILMMAGVAGAGTYLGSRPAISILSQTMAAGNPQLQAVANEYLHGPDRRKGQRRLAIMAALLGAGYGAFKHHNRVFPNTSKPKASPASPYKDNSYMPAPVPTLDLSLGNKDASVRITPNIIDKRQAINYIVTDPVLYDSNKRKVASLIQTSSPNRWTTPAQIGYTAIKAGAGFGAGYMLSQGLGSILAMPTPLVRRMSTTGGIASAVIGSGILTKLA